MPAPLLNAYAEQLPHLRAEESLRSAQEVAAGAGHLKRGERRRILQTWQREARQRSAVLRAATPETYAAHMAITGIAVKKVRPVSDG